MAGTPGYNESSVVLPSAFGPPGAALENLIDRKQQDKQFEYQKQKQNEMDEWRKIALMRDLTNLDQYQTGNDVADEIGKRQSERVLQKYTALAKTMSPSELLAKIQNEMSAVTSGMQGFKNDMQAADQQLAMLKQKFPSLDIASLAKKVREDAVKRRLKGDETFVNPMEVPPQTEIKLDDPDYLSDYIVSDDKLRESILNPRKEKAGVATGDIVSNVEYGGDVPFYSKTNYTPEQLKGGFLPKDFKPTYKPKEVPISTDLLKGENGEQLMGVPEETLMEYSEGERGLQLLSATKKKFPNYKDLTEDQKKAAISNTLRERLGDEKPLPFITSKRAPVSMTKNYVDARGGVADANINDVYGRVYAELKRLKDYGEKEVKPNLLKADEQRVIGDALDNLNKGKDEGLKIELEDVWLELTDRNEVIVKDANRRLLFTLPKLASNLKNTPTSPGKKAVVAEGEPDKSAKPDKKSKPKIVKQNGVVYTLNEKTGQYE